MSLLPTTLLVFCKQPRLNQGKQRIAATLGAEPTLEIAQALLACALEDAKHWQGPVVLSPSCEADTQWASRLLPNIEVIAQPEGNLGERIMAVDAELRRRGHERILIIGTDAPVLNHDHYQSAIAALCNHDVVLSAASDGGVTLMASQQPWPDITDLPWSTELLNEALLGRCQQHGLDAGYITPSYDIDHEQDLLKLLIDLEHDHRPARQALCALVARIVKREQAYA